MDEIARAIATNYYLQATSILVAIVTGVFAIWSVRKPIWSFLSYFGGFILPRIWQPPEALWKFGTIGAKNPSYLIAVFVKQFIYVLGFALLWFLADTTHDALIKLPIEAQPDSWVLAVFATLRTTMSLVIGFRLGEISAIARNVIRTVEANTEL